MKKILFLLNATSVALVLFVNYYSQKGAINGKTIGSLSDEYDNLFTPASFAFAIWGIIFLGLIGFVIFQGISLLRESKQAASTSFEQMGFVFVWVNLGSALWVIVWLYEFTFISVLIMIGMLIGLITLLNRVSTSDRALSIVERFFIVSPIAIYAGWITVATIANFSAYFSKIGWIGTPFTGSTWTVIMIVIAVMVNLFVTWEKSIKAFSLVGIWALYAIYIRHQSSYELIAMVALSGLIVLTISIVIKVLKERQAINF